jgi:hypothetical protein
VELVWDLAGGQDHYEATASSFIGWDGSHPPLGSEEPSEVLVQLAVRDHDRKKIDRDFAPMIVGSMLQSMPGMTVPAEQGRPRVADVVAHWPALISRDSVHPTVTFAGKTESVSAAAAATVDPASIDGMARGADAIAPYAPDGSEAVTVPLMRLCLGRSGDKGDTANVGILARSPEIFSWLATYLTADVVKNQFKGICQGEVERHPLPNLLSVNFLLHNSLGGGGTSSLIFDAQGKTYSQYLLSMEVTVPSSLLATAG